MKNKINEEYNKIIKSMLGNESIKNMPLLINDCEVELTFHLFLCNIKDFHKYFISLITKENCNYLEKIYPGIYYPVNIINNDLNAHIMMGNLILKVYDSIYIVIIQNLLNRSISESFFDAYNIFSSKDGLVESIDTNIALIQKRLKSSNIIVNNFRIGERSKTDVRIMYIDDLANKQNVKAVKKILNNISTDAILSSTDIYNYFSKNSLFPSVLETGSPEIVASNIYSGKIAIIIDQVPIAILVPINIFSLLIFDEGKKSSPVFTVYNRLISGILIFLSVFFLGIYAALITYHSKNLTIIMVSELKTSLKGNTTPLIIEFLLLIFLFELLRLSTARSPKNSLQSILGIVGGLLIGQNAVNSGIISSFNLVITAICYISTYAVTSNQRLIFALSILRIIVLLSGLFFGLYGVIITSIILINYLVNKKSLKTDYLAPIAPFFKIDAIKLLLSNKFLKHKYRNKNLHTIDLTKGD